MSKDIPFKMTDKIISVYRNRVIPTFPFDENWNIKRFSIGGKFDRFQSKEATHMLNTKFHEISGGDRFDTITYQISNGYYYCSIIASQTITCHG